MTNNNSKHLPPTSRPYISLIANHCITICGPPSTLQALETSKLAGCRVVKLGLYAPYHARHLFTAEDIDNVLNTTTVMGASKYHSRRLVISSATGAMKPAENYHDLIRGAVEDILINPIIWEDVMNGIAYISRFSNASKLSLFAVGTTATDHLSNGLRQRGWAVETFELHHHSPSCSSTLRHEAVTHASESTYKTASGKSKIAIVGISGRFPEANDLETFWDILFRGLDVHKVVPPSRWNAATHVDPTGSRKNTSRTPYGCWLRAPGAFDATFFNTTPREAFQIDPASRLALMTAYEAMENAGMVPGTTRSTQKHRVGVAYGVTSNDWMEVNSAQNVDTFFIPGGCRAFIPGRINYVFNLSGPSYSVDTACSSSLSAIHIACNSLWQGDADTMIAGGTNILTNPDYTAGLDRGHFLSRTGNCKSFDQTADGYCRAEGICSIILKRLDDAIAENDPILGVILGAYTNHSAEADSITRPLVGAQQQVLRKILNDSNIEALDVSYVEMHGTGTRVGDPIEMESVVSTFAPAAGRGVRDANKPLYVGAVKSNVGHGEAAAGVTSLAKVLLMMKHHVIPPHAGLRTRLNENFPADMKDRNVHIAHTPLTWKSQGTRRKAFINNFSAAGGNSALLVEEPPEPFIDGTPDPRSTHIVSVSAKSATSLRRNVESLIAFLSADSEASAGMTLPAISYTLTARRSHYPFRLAVHGTSTQQIQTHLEALLERHDGFARVRGCPKVAFAFTGNGSQYAGMGQQLYQHSHAFRAHLTRLDKLVQQQGFQSIIPFCSSADGQTGDLDIITTQLATICLELALSKLWISWGIKPSCAVGHSLGEYAALAVAGVLSEADVIFLAGRRAQLLVQKCQNDTHAMLAAHAPLSSIESCLAGRSEIACINGPEDIVLAGTVGEVSEAFDRLRQQGIKGSPLSGIQYAFHSAQVDPILDDLVAACENVTFHKPSIPVLSPLLGTVVTEVGTFSPQYLRQHCRETVNMFGVLRNAHSAGVLDSRSVVLEIGPSPLICRMVQNTLGLTVLALASLKRNHDSLSLLTESLSSLYKLGCNIDWKEYHAGFPMSHSVVQMPSYNWDLKDYWIQYTNDWSLRKGDPVPESLQAPVTFSVPLDSPGTQVPWGLEADIVPKLQSSTIHEVVEDTLDGDKVVIVVETDLSRADVISLAQGHKVNGVPLATPSIYAEISMRIGQHIVDKYQPCLRGRIITADDMTIERALVAHGGPEPQILRSTVKFNAKDNCTTCHFETLDPKTKNPRRHSHCRIEFREPSTTRMALRNAYTESAKQRIEALSKAVATGGAYRFSKNMVYKIVGSLAQFESDYRQVEEIVLNSETMEACSKVNFRGLASNNGSYHTNPAAIDSLSQSAGFIMNGNDSADLETEVFVNHGWKSFQLFEPISTSKNYTTYCAMRRGPSNSWEGDCIVLDDHDVVAWFGGINLQGVPRRVLSYILAQEYGGRLASATAKQLPRAPALQALHMAEQTPELEVVLSSKIQIPVAIADATEHIVHPGLKTSQSVHSRPTSGRSDPILPLLRIFSQETGIAESELSYDSQLADLGIDSLLMLQLASRINEDLQINVDTVDMTGLQNIGTLADLCALVDPGISKSASSPNHREVAPPLSQLGIEASLQRSSDTVHISVTPLVERCVQPNVSAHNLESLNPIKETDRVSKAMQILSEETGVGVSELTDDVLFADMGIDSLLSLMILARYHEDLDLEDHDSSNIPFFVRFNTVGDFKHFISCSGSLHVADSTPLERITTPSAASTPESTLCEITRTNMTNLVPRLEPVRPASSVILQGKPRVDPHTLFLFPDGSGSATSYVGMGPVREGLALVGLNCPYILHPEELEYVTPDALMESYLTEVRRRQPWGPYRLGGWSAGGILAFRAAQILIQEGEQVESLVLIDSPPPTGLDPLPEHWYEHCTSADLFGTISRQKGTAGIDSGRESLVPTTLIPHFRAQVKVLQDFVAEPLPAGFTPRTSILWAGECVFDGRPGRPVFQSQPGDPEGIKFLTQRRVDETAGAWGLLFPHDEPSVTVMRGEDHFSMMQSRNGERLAAFVSDAVI